jgi:hypothetical protein
MLFLQKKTMFHQFGFFKEYYVNDKFIGFLKTEKDRDIIGFSGRKNEIINNDVILENKKKIKSGTKVVTILYPLCGQKM